MRATIQVVFTLVALAGCSPCPSADDVWLGNVPTLPIAPKAKVEIPVAWPGSCADLQSSDPMVATFELGDNPMRVGNDGPGSMTVHHYFIGVSAGQPGSAQLIVRQHDGGQERVRTPVNVGVVATIALVQPQPGVPISHRSPPLIQFVRRTADGTELIGIGGATCSATAPLSVDVDCHAITPTGVGTGILTVTTSNVTRDFMLEVVDP